MAIASQSHLFLVSVDSQLADESLDAAVAYRLRGSDAIYVAVAQRYSSILVTRHREQRERVLGSTIVRNPDEILADW